MMTARFANSLIEVRKRFASMLDSRLHDIDISLSKFRDTGNIDALAEIHRSMHSISGIGPTLGYVATSLAARAVEHALVESVRAQRSLTNEELAHVVREVDALRLAAYAESQSIREKQKQAR